MTDDTRDVRAALATLTNDVDVPPTLVERGVHRGRRLRTRRRLAVAAGAVASVAVVAGAAGIVGGLGGTSGGPVASGGPVVYRSTTEPAFDVAARPSAGSNVICFRPTGPNAVADSPRLWTCWDPDTRPGWIESAPLRDGWALAVGAVYGDVPLMAFIPPEGGGRPVYVPTVSVPFAPATGWRFAFAPFRGHDRQRGTFVPVENISCADGSTDLSFAAAPNPLMAPNPEAAVRALLGGVVITSPDVPPAGGYRQLGLAGENSVTFRREGGAALPTYRVEARKTGTGGWVVVWIGRCTGGD